MKQTYLFVLLGCMVLAACSTGPDTQATATVEARQHLIETESVAIVDTAVAQAGTQTALAVPSATPTATVTSTPLPTATATPGPLVIDDDFSSLGSRWQGCSVCSIKDGALLFGPYPSVSSLKGYITLCQDCGVVHEYKMSVDATFSSGASDRGFGFVLREEDGKFLDLEITTWQVYGVWSYDPQGGDSAVAWTSLLSKAYLPTPYLNPGVIKNHIEVQVVGSEVNDSMDLVKLSFNGTLLNTIEVKRGSGHVGLAVGLHSIGVLFDNFHFEGMPEPGSSGG